MGDYLKEIIEKEGDFKTWVYKCENGIEYTCQIRRNKMSLHLCGYVILTEDSDYFGVDYDDIRVDCHGGLTYASDQGPYWVIGFDCAHLGDLQPGYEFGGAGEYRTMDYVTVECESICEQISNKSKSYNRTTKLNQLI